MAVEGERVTVGTSATLLSKAESDLVRGSRVKIKVPAALSAIEVGGSGVTAGAGYELPSGEDMTLVLDPGEEIYGIVSSGTVEVHVLRQGV